MRRFLTHGLIFLLLPLLVAEFSIRFVAPDTFSGVRRLNDFYRPVKTSPSSAQYLFIGDSRVAAAIDVNTFTEELGKSHHDSLVAFNVGQGYSTLAEHYLAISSLLRKYPDRIDSTVVFLGAPYGTPSSITWDSTWTHPDWPVLLSEYLSVHHYSRYWLDAEDPVPIKLYVTAGSFLQSVRYWRYIKGKVVSAPGKVAAFLISDSSERGDVADLRTDGGIRTDSAGVALAREKAVRRAEESKTKNSQLSNIDWDATIFSDLVELVRAHGGDVTVFNVPLSSVDARSLKPTQGIPQSFKSWASSNHVNTIEIDAQYPDGAFPDLWHLSASKAPDFTDRLASAYQKSSWQRRR